MVPRKKESFSSEDWTTGDMVLCKVGRYDPWPSIVFPRQFLSKDVLKRAKPGRICICFFNDPTYYWANPERLDKLTPEIINKYLRNFTKSEEPRTDLLLAYKHAKKYNGLESFIRNRLKAEKRLNILKGYDVILEHEDPFIINKPKNNVVSNNTNIKQTNPRKNSKIIAKNDSSKAITEFHMDKELYAVPRTKRKYTRRQNMHIPQEEKQEIISEINPGMLTESEPQPIITEVPVTPVIKRKRGRPRKIRPEENKSNIPTLIISSSEELNKPVREVSEGKAQSRNLQGQSMRGNRLSNPITLGNSAHKVTKPIIKPKPVPKPMWDNKRKLEIANIFRRRLQLLLVQRDSVPLQNEKDEAHRLLAKMKENTKDISPIFDRESVTVSQVGQLLNVITTINDLSEYHNDCKILLQSWSNYT
ncbi:hypothetical protein TBLA_0J00160 [Henningerozyma blattae CBS 6284]|uniref:PWWP domain-containing protein n=1 Tax=Henningerozyma blattae (strain ATCC 34711 / CBS 6284 / DSM 70876 / NBRC 10599 / NRRL Y-10934 / UCD 77-7) TaxID=1071380 RepID=I2H9G5_HENB6|nr:hypothetical protein TBLA_0J00160 [Tetrapisispora blattae CBS 6284]CCH63017.1 hypothetical protein TBLA_0J00160 [Tetrapisispora blattae CBS 6284]